MVLEMLATYTYEKWTKSTYTVIVLPKCHVEINSKPISYENFYHTWPLLPLNIVLNLDDASDNYNYNRSH